VSCIVPSVRREMKAIDVFHQPEAAREYLRVARADQRAYLQCRRLPMAEGGWTKILRDAELKEGQDDVYVARGQGLGPL
jgi:hypothetical protein